MGKYDLKGGQVVIIVGSESDFNVLKESGLLEVLQEIEISFYVAVISAHRNLKELIEFCEEAISYGALVFIGVAGMATALPGAIAGATRVVPVIGVPLDEKGLSSVIYMPPGVPVLCPGIGVSGLKNAAIAVCQILGLKDSAVRVVLANYIFSKNKGCWFKVPLEEIMKKVEEKK